MRQDRPNPRVTVHHKNERLSAVHPPMRGGMGIPVQDFAGERHYATVRILPSTGPIEAGRRSALPGREPDITALSACEAEIRLPESYCPESLERHRGLARRLRAS
jgi:hypothetical protein